MALTDTKVKSVKPTEKTQKLFDGGGLYLEVTPKGGKRWRLKYRFTGKEKLLSLGVYPEVKLKVARERRDELRKLLAEGVDPSANRKAAKAAAVDRASNSFETVAREWHEKYSKVWAESHSKKLMRRLERDIFPWIGGMPISEVTAQDILPCLRRIEKRGVVETAHRALQNCGQVFRYAVATGRAPRDPSADLRGALPPVKGGHFAAVTDPKRVGELLRAIDGFNGTFVCQCALKIAPLVFVRPGELRHAQWADIDLNAREWRYLVTKTKTQHIVPLSSQAVEILEDLQALTGNGKYVFPSARGASRPMSENALLAAMRGMGIPKEEMTGHGFRATARTLLDEVLGFAPHLIEHQLAHAVRDPNGRAYNRTAHLPQRRKMMQAWADYLDGLKEGASVIPLKREG